MSGVTKPIFPESTGSLLDIAKMLKPIPIGESVRYVCYRQI